MTHYGSVSGARHVDLVFDGGCIDNPNGRAASGAIVSANGRTLRHVGRAIEIGSNNVAEWTGLLIGLEVALALNATSVHARGDSDLVVKQFTGEYAVRAEELRALSMQVHQLRSRFADVSLTWWPRRYNHAADAICNAVLADTYVPDPAVAITNTNGGGATSIEVSFVCYAGLTDVALAASTGYRRSIEDLQITLALDAERLLTLASEIDRYTVRPVRIHDAKRGIRDAKRGIRDAKRGIRDAKRGSKPRLSTEDAVADVAVAVAFECSVAMDARAARAARARGVTDGQLRRALAIAAERRLLACGSTAVTISAQRTNG